MPQIPTDFVVCLIIKSELGSWEKIKMATAAAAGWGWTSASLSLGGFSFPPYPAIKRNNNRWLALGRRLITIFVGGSMTFSFRV
jgi:hypothetical protein